MSELKENPKGTTYFTDSELFVSWIPLTIWRKFETDPVLYENTDAINILGRISECSQIL